MAALIEKKNGFENPFARCRQNKTCLNKQTSLD